MGNEVQVKLERLVCLSSFRKKQKTENTLSELGSMKMFTCGIVHVDFTKKKLTQNHDGFV